MDALQKEEINVYLAYECGLHGEKTRHRKTVRLSSSTVAKPNT